MTIISKKCLRGGQLFPYGDSVYDYEIEISEPASDDEVWKLCQTFKRAYHRDDNQKHNGHCGFPFALDSYGSLKRTGETSYRYTVTEPYDD